MEQFFYNTYLSLTVCPEIDDHGDQVVEAGVGALVGENGGQGEQRQRGEAGLQAAVDAGAGDEDEGVLPCDHPQAHDHVDDLQYRERLHCRVERLGQKVEEDLWPEEALESGGDLVCVMCKRPLFGSCSLVRYHLQTPAVRVMSLAQWFLISLPMLTVSFQVSFFLVLFLLVVVQQIDASLHTRNPEYPNTKVAM